jgi:transcription initiation factor TFIIH subunit 1
LELNHHAAVVLRGQPQVNIVDARTAAIAARDHEKSAESARIGFEEPDYSIDDLAAPKPAAPPKELKIRDSHQYFSSIAEEPVVSKPSKTHVVIEPFKEAVASALSTLQHPEKKQKRALDPDIALQVLKEVTQSLAKVEDLSAQFASQQSFSNADDVAAFPENVNEQLRRSAATGGELLRQFWMSTPMITSVRWEKATKVCKSVEILYDKLEGVKSSLPSAHRHIASQRLRPLLGAFDSALTFYDDEKTRRPQAYADFEKTATQENS